MTPSRIAVAIWNALKSKPAMLRSVSFWSVAMFTTKKNSAMNTGGMTASRSRGTARSARPAMVITSWTKPAGRGRMALARIAGTVVVETVLIVFIG